MKSIYVFVAAVIFSVVALSLFVYIETITYGVVCIFLSMILVEYGISKRLIEEKSSVKKEVVEIKTAELAQKLTEDSWKDFRNITKHSSGNEILSGLKFKNFLKSRKIADMARRMKSNGVPNQIIGKEIIKEFKRK